MLSLTPVRMHWGDQIQHDAALVVYLNKHQGRLECRLRAQCVSVVLNKDCQ